MTTKREKSSKKLLHERREYSLSRINAFENEINLKIKRCVNHSIFYAGSFGRLEAGQYSDIDLFVLSTEKCSDKRKSKDRIITNYINNCVDSHKFPKSHIGVNHKTIYKINEIIDNIGNFNDDYNNYFTTRLLLLLESKCLYNQTIYNKAISTILDSYLRDYPRHKNGFLPTFLVNDIIRYWKTLCLNYENKRNKPTHDEKKKNIQRVKNFKLKFSRMNTCYATIAYLICMDNIDQDKIIELTKYTPMERLELSSSTNRSAHRIYNMLLSEYSWFLELTNLPTEDLHKLFLNNKYRHYAFGRARLFGDLMYKLLITLDKKDYLRYIVI